MHLKIRTIGNGKYASVVQSIRCGNKVSHKTILYIGKVTDDQIPYLKAAYTPKENRPKLVYKDGTVYET